MLTSIYGLPRNLVLSLRSNVSGESSTTVTSADVNKVETLRGLHKQGEKSVLIDPFVFCDKATRCHSQEERTLDIYNRDK